VRFSQKCLVATGHDLDMNTAVSTVNFDHDGVHYQREYFVSYPDEVAVVRLSASQPGKLSFTTSTAAASGLTTTAVADANEKRITLAGQVADNQMRAEMQLKLENQGGTVSSSDGRTLTVSGADSVTLVYTTGTNYKNEYPTYRGEDPHAKLTQRVDSAIASGYGALLDRHLTDYQELFSRVQFDVGAAVPDIPTDELMRNYRTGSHDLAVDQMAYQFGRYLSIAGSRIGDLPTNLCGLWMIGSASVFWGADYHFNVNDGAPSDSLYVLGAYATPVIGVGNIQPMARYQWAKIKGVDGTQPWNIDAGISYLVKGPALRLLATYSHSAYPGDITANSTTGARLSTCCRKSWKSPVTKPRSSSTAGSCAAVM